MATYLGFDIGSNSVGSAWIDTDTGEITTGVSIFPAGVDESDEKRGDPKNAKRRMTRRTRITLHRRSARKRKLRLTLIEAGLLPTTADEFKGLLETTDPWELRRTGLDEPLTAHQFGRVLLHLAQRRGALGLKLADLDDTDDGGSGDDGKVKAAVKEVRAKLGRPNARTFGDFVAGIRSQRVIAIATPDQRPADKRKGPREFRAAVRNKAGNYEHCADREMIRHEFHLLWDKQKSLGGEAARLLTDELRRALDDESGDAIWRHRGLLFGQRRQSWDLGTLGRCVLEPAERCVPHADMHASRYLVVETLNNLKIIERGKPARPLTIEEREKIKTYLSGPLGTEKPRKTKKGNGSAAERPKTKVTVSDLRRLMGTSDEGWGERFGKHSQFRFNIETDENREINTDWFSREVIRGAVTLDKWSAMPTNVREGINHAILKFDPEQEGAAERLKNGVMTWAGLSETQAEALVAAWKRRPKLDAKRLNMSRRAVCNILPYMDEAFTEVGRQDGRISVLSSNETDFDPARHRWMTQIEARKAYAQDLKRSLAKEIMEKDRLSRAQAELEAENSPTFKRYATGAKGATARDRHYLAKHVLYENGEPVLGPDNKPLAEPPPAPLISNPVVRKAIHEVRRHLVEYMVTFRKRPDFVFIELAREARMGQKDADRLLFKNRLRNRIRSEILEEFNLHSVSATQQRAAVDRVVMAVQQGCICPLCGKRMGPEGNDGLTLRRAAIGEGCQVAHIIPRASGGHNGMGNIVLAHTKCNQEMQRRTPRQFWELTLKGGFAEGVAWVEKMFAEVERPKASETKSTTGVALWSCYFGPWDDKAKLDQFKKDVKDIQQMTARQEAATKYATREVMAYLADAIYHGKGLPERGGERRIFATDGIWTSRLRREWGLFFDPHDKKLKGLTNVQEQERREKDRGDHRHHAIDAVVIALTEQVRGEWDMREKRADVDGVNTADEQQMENYRRTHPISPPRPFKTGDNLRDAVKIAVFGEGPVERPVCHRQVKRKLIGALHEETLFGPVLDCAGNLTDNYTAKKGILSLDPNHLRMPRLETSDEAVERLTRRRIQQGGANPKAAAKWARSVVASKGYRPAVVDPPPGKSGIVRDVALRARLRECLSEAGINPDDFSSGEIKKLVTLRARLRECLSESGINPDHFSSDEIEAVAGLRARLHERLSEAGIKRGDHSSPEISKLVESGAIKHASGVPIGSVVLLRTMSDPVIIARKRPEYGSKELVTDADPATRRAYVGGNNHHIEIRASRNKKGGERWSGVVVSAFVAAQRKLNKLRAVRRAAIPDPTDFRKLPKAERARYRPLLREIELAHPLVDRADNDEKGGRFVMSLCEGEMLMMKTPAKNGEPPGPVSYFVVAELERPKKRIVLVPHWDARAAGERKDAEGKKVANSKREEFTVTPSDLKELAPPGKPHAVKVRVSPLAKIAELVRD